MAVNKKLTASFKNMKRKAWDMPIKNLTRKTTIAKEFRTTKSSMEKAVGFMFSEPKTALVMAFEKEKNISLHMFFVFGTIDVLFLDRNMKVVELKREFRPFTAYTSGKKAKYAVELPKGSIKKSSTRTGDKLALISISTEKSRAEKKITIK